MEELIEVPAGLHNVAVTDTMIGDVRGDEGFYHYRQYDATDLARTATFEDVRGRLVPVRAGLVADRRRA
jgi:citrate synthase